MNQWLIALIIFTILIFACILPVSIKWYCSDCIEIERPDFIERERPDKSGYKSFDNVNV